MIFYITIYAFLQITLEYESSLHFDRELRIEAQQDLVM